MTICYQQSVTTEKQSKQRLFRLRRSLPIDKIKYRKNKTRNERDLKNRELVGCGEALPFLTGNIISSTKNVVNRILRNSMKFYSCSCPELIWEGDSPAVPQMAGLPAVSCAEEDKYCMWCRWANVGKSTGRSQKPINAEIDLRGESSTALVGVGILPPIVREA